MSATSHERAALDPAAIYAVEQCVQGQYRNTPQQLVTAGFIEALRDAAFAANVDFAAAVEPFFVALDSYDRCVFSWRGLDGCWAMLMFGERDRAMLSVVGAPRLQKLVGSFPYCVCDTRKALRITDVGSYPELLISPCADCSGDVTLSVPGTDVALHMRNETPQRLCRSAVVSV